MSTTQSMKEVAADWTVRVDEWSEDAVTHNGNLFLLGNGYMGYRGTLEEFGPDEKVGILIPGLYDQVGDAWREPVNAPNGLYTTVSVNGVPLNPLITPPSAHQQCVDMRTATHLRQSTFEIDGVTAVIQAERFLSADEVNLMTLHYRLTITGDAEVEITTGIDERIWDLNGPHLDNLSASHTDNCVALTGKTHERGDSLVVAEACNCDRDGNSETGETDGVLRRFTFSVSGETEITLDKFVTVYSSLDGDDEGLLGRASVHASEALDKGYVKLRESHTRAWDSRWQRADIGIEGDDEGQHALRYSLYQLLSAAPFHSEFLSIPARALSGQVYKGAVFWDTEIFMFPFFLAAFPEVARNLVRYRIHTLDGARAKAREYGFEGAFYAWEGQDGGHDACTLFNITDVFTNRPMRTYFRDKQIHISGDVAWAIWQYYLVTGDLSLLAEGGFEVMLECARFFHSYAYRRTRNGEYVLLDVTGPDEYHERISNNAYTNYLAHYAVDALLQTAQLLEDDGAFDFGALCKELNFSAEDKARFEDFKAQLYLPAPDPESAVIEQFDGYLTLEGCSLEELKSRVLNPNEYLGGGNGLATTTQILKQADVVLLMNLLRDRFTSDTKQKNWEFYEPRTEHGSSLSACAYALVAAEIGKLDFAYKYFLKTATIDLTGKSKQYVGTLYIGGTHPAANGGAWMVAVQGFAGARLSESGLNIEPRMPEHWSSLEFSLFWQGQRIHICIEDETILLSADAGNAKPVPVNAPGWSGELAPGAEQSV